MTDSTQTPAKKRTRVSRPYPQHRLEEVLGIARAIQEKNAGLPFDRVRLAKSMGTTPASSAFTMKLNASVKYGLTEGGYSDARISLTELGTQAAQSDPNALLQAAIRPEKLKTFYELLDGKRIPALEEASGIVVDDIGVPEDLTEEFLTLATDNGEFVRIVTQVGNSYYVSLADVSITIDKGIQPRPESLSSSADVEQSNSTPPERPSLGSQTPVEPHNQQDEPVRKGRLLVAHSGGGAVVNRIIRMLDDLGIPHGVVEIDPIDSSPLSKESLAEMPRCSGAIIVMAGPSQVVSTPGVASSRASKMLIQLGSAVERFKDHVVMVIASESDHFLQTVKIRRVYFENDDLGKFELDLLRGLVNAEMMLLSIPGRIS